MPKFVSVSEDDAVQYSPNQSTYYELHPQFDKTFQSYKTPYESTKIDPKEQVVLKSKGIHHCHTVIIKDRTYNSYFMLHVSPQSLRRPYDPVNKEVGTLMNTSGFGLFSMDSDTAMTNSKKPAYIDLDPYYFDGKLGTHPDSELEVIVVANHEYWNTEKVQQNILKTLQERVPGKISKSNVIINEALQHAYYYSVAFDPKSESLTVISDNGLYTEPYEKAFDNNVHQYANEMLPAEKQTELKNNLKDLRNQAVGILEPLFGALSPYDGLEQLVLNPPHNFIELARGQRTQIESLINKMESVISESKNPVINLGSPALYDTYKQLGLLYVCAENYSKSAFYFSKAADYATSMQKAEYEDDKLFFSTLAGAACERSGDLNNAYAYYKNASFLFLGYVKRADANINIARVASQIKGKELKALEAVIEAKESLDEAINQVKEEVFPEKEKTLEALNLRLARCDDLLHSLQNVLIEHRHENEELQHEYDKLFALSTVVL
ncbi:hypothetical protein [Legionella sp. WA2022007384]